LKKLLLASLVEKQKEKKVANERKIFGMESQQVGSSNNASDLFGW
jgi:hypothetical protein